jgi:hypothetical protein
MERDIQPSFPFQEKTESSILRSIYLIPKDESIKNIKYTVTQRARGLGKSHAVVACEWVGDKAWKISLPGLVWQIFQTVLSLQCSLPPGHKGKF